MKLLILCLCLLLNFNLLAYSAPSSHIGDSANFVFSQDGMKGEYVVKVKKYKAGKYLIEASTRVGSQTQVSFDPMDESSLMTHKKAKEILQYCDKIGGKLERLAVRGKNFNTCKLPATMAFELGLITKDSFGDKEISDDAAVWASDVPVLGVVKMINAGFVLKIVGYHWN